MLIDSSDPYSANYLKQMEYVLESLCVGHDTIDVTKQEIPSFENYETVVLLTPDYSALEDKLLPLFEWANNGGRILNLEPLEPTPITKTMLSSLGIEDTRGSLYKNRRVTYQYRFYDWFKRFYLQF